VNGPALYEETQSFSPWVVALLLAVVLLLGALLSMRLTTTVRPDAISVRVGFF